MAYGVKYRTYTTQIHSLNKITADIYKKDYFGGITILRTEKDGFSITLDTTDYFDVYASTSCELQIVNNLTNFFELDELFSVSDFEYYVKIYDTSYTYFEGFIPCDVVEQSYLPNGTITLNAANNLKRLSDFVPTMFTVVGGYLLIDILHHILSFTGLSLPIYVNCVLFARQDYEHITDRSVFDQTYVSSEVFLSNDNEYETCADILTDILSTVDCKLYYWNGAWYIERIKDLGLSSKNYIKYIPGDPTIYHISFTNTPIAIGRNNNSKVRYANTNQTIKYTPGAKQVKLSLKEDVKLNLVNYYFNNIIDVGSSETVEEYNPDFGTWEVDNYCTVVPFTNANNMTNGVTMYNTNPANIHPIYINISTTDFADYLSWYRSSLSGLYAKFRFTVNSTGDTSITIKLSIKLPADFLADHVYANYGTAAFMYDKDLHPADWKFYMRVFLRNGPGFPYFVYYNTSTSKYEIVSRSNILYATYGTRDPCIIELETTWENFTNRDLYYHEFTMTIPVDDFKDDLVSSDFILGICELGFVTPHVAREALKSSIFGDVYVTVNNEDEDNVVTGNVNLDFVDVVEQDVKLYDVTNLNILNGLFIDEDLLFPTLQWHDTQGYSPILVVDRMIEDRFQLLHKVRREITTDLYYIVGSGIPPLRPFVFLTDSHFTNNFYVNGFQWLIESNVFQNVSLKEYVSYDNIT